MIRFEKNVPKTRVCFENGLPKKTPLEVRNPKFRIKHWFYIEYEKIVNSEMFRSRLKNGFWLQDIVDYLSEKHHFNLFKILNLKQHATR